MGIRTFEMARVAVHFSSRVWGETYYTGQSNYSLTLGFARDIGFWDPQNTPEDFHTGMKAFFFSNGSITQASAQTHVKYCTHKI